MGGGKVYGMADYAVPLIQEDQERCGLLDGGYFAAEVEWGLNTGDNQG